MNSLNDNYNNNNEVLNKSIDEFNNLCKESDCFLAYDSQKSQQFIDLTKCLFDVNKRLVKENINEKSKILSIKTSLDELFTIGFDVEQVWQQIQLQNKPTLNLLAKEVADISVKSSRLGLDIKTQNESKTKKTKNKKIAKKVKFKETIDENESKVVENGKQIPNSIVDDMFFKLHELEEFLNKEDLKEDQKRSGVQELMSEESDEDIDYFVDSEDSDFLIGANEDILEEPNGREAMFRDFFDEPIGASVEPKNLESNEEELDEVIDEEMDTRDVDINDIEDNEREIDLIADESTSSDSEDETFKQKDKQKDLNENKSEFERIQELLKEKIAKQERENLRNKSWQMSGEIVSEKRPENSLLEEHLHFDHTSRPAPVITEETSVKLEDIIKQRIKDMSFDDVIRKVKPKEKPFEYKRRITMESEKSKQSLSQIYENEYLQQQQKDREEEEIPEQKEIKKLMRNLFLQLDALSNFNFTPRPPQPEIKIINNLPAITVEEVTPLAVSDVSLLAPQEVFNNQKRELQSTSEKSKTDRNRGRRVKKKFQRKTFKYNESKQKTIKKKSKEPNVNSEDTKHLSSSKRFFDKLQEKTTQSINKSKSEINNSNKSLKQSNKLKL